MKTLRLLEDNLTKCGKETIDWDTVFKVYEIKEIINSSSKTRLGSLSALSTTNCLSELWCWNQFQKCIKIALKMQMKCRKYPCEEKISKNVLETNLKKKRMKYWKFWVKKIFLKSLLKMLKFFSLTTLKLNAQKCVCNNLSKCSKIF